jgi:hypothetical protein
MTLQVPMIFLLMELLTYLKHRDSTKLNAKCGHHMEIGNLEHFPTIWILHPGSIILISYRRIYKKEKKYLQNQLERSYLKFKLYVKILIPSMFRTDMKLFNFFLLQMINNWIISYLQKITQKIPIFGNNSKSNNHIKYYVILIVICP